MTKLDPQGFLRSLVNQKYDEAADQEHNWSLGDVASAVEASAIKLQIDKQVLRLAIGRLVEQCDERHREQLGSGQVSLLTMQPEALDSVLPLGDGLRVKLRYAELPDLDNWYSLQLRNHTAVVQAFSNKTSFYFQIRTDMVTNGGTVGEAWARLHP